MAHIAIFCDGTWNSATISLPTHVHELYQACAKTDEQHTHYFPGVGTGLGKSTWLGKRVDKLAGGLFGWGLNTNIRAAYKWLCEHYTPGDKILIFGFSRGAYTARSLAGMIRKCGILADPSDENVRDAFRLYRKAGPENAPDEPHIWAERRRISPKFATSAHDVMERLAAGDAGENEPFLVRISYLGVWDTVGALGIPPSVLGAVAVWMNTRHEFHDTRLTSLVEAARHAVALDERRIFFEPALWDNLEASLDHPGLNNGDRSPDRPYQQVWFVGDHALVGGSAKTRALTEISLDWMWEGAANTGLKLKDGRKIPDFPIQPDVDTTEIYDTHFFYKLMKKLDWRAGPGHDIDLHPSVRVRLDKLKTYRPRSLRNLMRDLIG